MSAAAKVSQIIGIHEIRSEIDPRQSISQEQWSVTLVCAGVSRDFFRRSGAPSVNALTGHSMIMIESVDKMDRYNRGIIHLINDGRSSRATLQVHLLGVFPYNREWPRSDTYLRSSEAVNGLVRSVITTQNEIDMAYAYNNPPPFQFSSLGYREGTDDKNCHTWSVEALSSIGINIPLLNFPVPGNLVCLIPRYSVRFVREICEILVERGHPVEEALNEEERGQIRDLSERIDGFRGKIKENGILLAFTLFTIPPAVIIYADEMIKDAMRCKDVEKERDAIKASALERYFKQDDIEEG